MVYKIHKKDLSQAPDNFILFKLDTCHTELAIPLVIKEDGANQYGVRSRNVSHWIRHMAPKWWQH